MKPESGQRPRRGPPRKTEQGARERITAVASDLFYREGIRATGVDTIAEQSGVSKTSLYRVFESKDELIAEYAREHDRRFWEKWNRNAAKHEGQPAKQLTAFLNGVAERIGEASYRGCPFMNIAIELPDDQHPARLIATENKLGLKRSLEDIASRLSAPDPSQVADQISTLINGAYASGIITRGSVVAQNLTAAVAAILPKGRK
ncbi:MAG: TetR/AcrR family transcriptional regulator [Pseudomonadota bacterium]